jgi:hypothetical protein
MPEGAWFGPDGGFLPGHVGWLPDLGSDHVTFEVRVRTPESLIAVVTGDLVNEPGFPG